MADWDDKPTVIRKSGSGGASRSAAAVNRALATGQGNVEIRKKNVPTAGANKQHAEAGSHLYKIENSEEFKVKTVDKEISKAIISGRQVKELNQKDFATMINEKIQVVQEYEQGKATPNNAILGKMERVLGVKLRGANVGQPLR